MIFAIILIISITIADIFIMSDHIDNYEDKDIFENEELANY